MRAAGGEIMARLLAFFQAFPKSGPFAPSFSKESFAVLWDFNGLQATRPDNDVSPNFSPLPPTFRPIPAAAAPHSGAARCRGARARARDCVAKGSVAFMEVGRSRMQWNLEFSSFLINRKKNVRRSGLLEPFSIQRPLRRREISAADACRTKPSERPFGRRSPTNVSGGSTHSPDFAAHVHEIETATRQLAEGFGVAEQNRRPYSEIGVLDFVTVFLIEMPHGNSNRVEASSDISLDLRRSSNTLRCDAQEKCCNAPSAAVEGFGGA
jgi:hypothetical protein